MEIFLILFIIVFIFMATIAFISPIKWIITFSKNKSKIELGVNNKEDTINFREKYPKLAEEHDEIYKKIKKEFALVPFVIMAFASFFMMHINVIFIIIFPVLIIGIAITAAFIDKTPIKRNLDKEYINILYKDIIYQIFNIVKRKKNDLNEDSEYEEYLSWEEYNKDKENIIKDIMKKTNKKCYSEYSIDDEFYCEMNRKIINIIKFSNYKRIRTNNTTGADGRVSIYSFIGYVIIIPKFNKIELLNLCNEDYYFDETNNILYLIISDETKNLFIACSDNRGMPNYNKTFDKCNWLQKKYNYYMGLKSFVEKLT